MQKKISKGRLQRQQVRSIGSQTGSDHLYDNRSENRRGTNAKGRSGKKRLSRRPM